MTSLLLEIGRHNCKTHSDKTTIYSRGIMRNAHHLKRKNVRFVCFFIRSNKILPKFESFRVICVEIIKSRADVIISLFIEQLVTPEFKTKYSF